MAIDTTSPRTRRAILLGALGGVAASVAASVGRASPVSAHDPDDVRLGADNTVVPTRTLIAAGLEGTPVDAFVGLAYYGGTGVIGQSSEDAIGVYGYSGPWLPPALTAPAKTGVLGVANQDATSVGVLGKSDSGIGLRGEATTGRGGSFRGKKAQIRLEPSSALSHPTSGQKGDLFVDTSGRLWFCKGGTTWVKLA